MTIGTKAAVVVFVRGEQPTRTRVLPPIRLLTSTFSEFVFFWYLIFFSSFLSFDEPNLINKQYLYTCFENKSDFCLGKVNIELLSSNYLSIAFGSHVALE